MNEQTQLQADITTAKIAKKDFATAIREKQKTIEQFYKGKNKAEQIATQTVADAPPPKPTEPPKLPRYRLIVDERKEQELLQLAKAEYQSHKDIRPLAEKTGLKPGIVYHTLKHHNFIKQNETTEYRVLDAYYRFNGNLRTIAEETGLTVWICANTIKKMGLSPRWNDYRNHISRGHVAGQGADGEMEFLRLVPNAVDMNGQFQANNPTFDFVVGNKTIDVKTSKKRMSRGLEFWGVRLSTINYFEGERPDFYVLFAKKDNNLPIEAGNYHLFLIPSDILNENARTFQIGADRNSNQRSLFWDFEIEPSLLADILENQ